MEEGIQGTKQSNEHASLDAQPGRSVGQIEEFQLLWHQVVLLAMKHGRVPLPVSAVVWKGLQRHGVVNDLYDLGSIARRLSFLGDGRLLLDELKLRTAPQSPMDQSVAKEVEFTTEGHP
ncbi:MAG TPA: hypothetical protein VE263_08190 [Candidatus Angelobacter sp.]|nr:hypothetical protein [Candidatus Angelobacter sp.]